MEKEFSPWTFKQAQEVIFSRKIKKPNHPELKMTFVNNVNCKFVNNDILKIIQNLTQTKLMVMIRSAFGCWNYVVTHCVGL